MATVGGNLCQDTRCLYYNQSEFWRGAQPDCFKSGGAVCRAISGADRCHSAYQGDLAPVLIALEARVKLVTKESHRTIPLSELYTGEGERPIRLAPGEMLTEIEVPSPGGAGGADYQKLRYRGAMDHPLVGVAALLHRKGETCVKANLVVTAIASAPVLMEEAGRSLQGKRINEAIITQAAQANYEAAHPIAQIGSTSLYRRKMVRVLARRAIERAWGSGDRE
jgi:4-hydroxybenzoyl-CoA reductase beta subunit